MCCFIRGDEHIHSFETCIRDVSQLKEIQEESLLTYTAVLPDLNKSKYFISNIVTHFISP